MQAQFHYENLSWQRSIAFHLQENSFLKNRLAEVVDSKADRDFLAWAEHFQNQFIIKDEYMEELRHDVHEQERRLAGKGPASPSDTEAAVVIRQRHLRDQLDYLEKDFANLRREFHLYLAERL